MISRLALSEGLVLTGRGGGGAYRWGNPGE